MIPKIVHLSWKHKSILNSNTAIIQNGMGQFQKLNPDWDIQISDDDEVIEYLREKLDPVDFNLLDDRSIVEKLDVWRLIKLYEVGGMYIDVDRLYDTPMDSIIDDTIRCVLPTQRDYDFSHDIMISAPGNPIHLAAVQLNLQRRREGHTSVYLLGPQTYMHAITHVVMGEMIDTNPGIEKMNEIREKIKEFSFIKTYREDIPYHSVVFRGSVEFDHEQEKRNLYKEFDMKHWTGEW